MAKILLIEDEPEMLEAIREALTRASHQVTALDDGRAVVNGEVGSDFDLVVTDMVMPEVEGVETLTYLRKLKPDLKFIAISGGGMLEPELVLRIADRLGALRTFAKPFSLGLLVEAVEQVLNPDNGSEPQPSQT